MASNAEIYPIDPALTLTAAAKKWLEEHSRYIKPRTISGYREYFKALFSIFGDVPLNTIHITHVRNYQTERAKRAGNGRINQELSALHQVMSEAGCWRDIGFLYKPLPLPKLKSGHSLTAEEEKRLREVALSRPRWQVAGHSLIVMLSTTAGFGELRYLRRADVDLERRCIHLREGVKNDYRDRTIPLNTAAHASMLWLLERWKRLGGRNDDDFVLPHRRRRRGLPWIFDEPTSQAGIRTIFEKIRIAADLKHVRIYDMRVQAITKILSDPKVSTQVAKEIAGHICQAMQSKYSIQWLDTKRAALDALEPSTTLEVSTSPAPDLPGAIQDPAIQVEIQRQVRLALQAYQATQPAVIEPHVRSSLGPRLLTFPGGGR